MAIPGIRTISQPSYFRNRRNEGAADVPRGRILRYGSTKDGCALATANTDNLCGVSVETMEGTTNGVITRSVQRGGKVAVLSGAAIAIGDRLTTDATGRAIPTSAAGQSVIGKAETAATGADEWVECEIEFGST